MRLHLVVTPLVILFIASRVFIRLKTNTGLGLDDWAIIIAGLFYVANAGMAIPITVIGYGQHTWYLSPGDMILALKVSPNFARYFSLKLLTYVV